MIEPVRQEAVYLLNWEQFDFYWKQGVEQWVAQTDFGEYYTKEWLTERIRNGQVQAWALSDGEVQLVVFSRICEYPRTRVLQIFWGFGRDLDKFLEVADAAMDKAAKVVGANKIEIFGRPGWARKMRKLGFTSEWYVIGRDVQRRTEQ